MALRNTQYTDEILRSGLSNTRIAEYNNEFLRTAANARARIAEFITEILVIPGTNFRVASCIAETLSFIPNGGLYFDSTNSGGTQPSRPPSVHYIDINKDDPSRSSINVSTFWAGQGDATHTKWGESYPV
jgi:hypothetical protein